MSNLFSNNSYPNNEQSSQQINNSNQIKVKQYVPQISQATTFSKSKGFLSGGISQIVQPKLQQYQEFTNNNDDAISQIIEEEEQHYLETSNLDQIKQQSEISNEKQEKITVYNKNILFDNDFITKNSNKQEIKQQTSKGSQNKQEKTYTSLKQMQQDKSKINGLQRIQQLPSSSIMQKQQLSQPEIKPMQKNNIPTIIKQQPIIQQQPIQPIQLNQQTQNVLIPSIQYQQQLPLSIPIPNMNSIQGSASYQDQIQQQLNMIMQMHQQLLQQQQSILVNKPQLQQSEIINMQQNFNSQTQQNQGAQVIMTIQPKQQIVKQQPIKPQHFPKNGLLAQYQDQLPPPISELDLRKPSYHNQQQHYEQNQTTTTFSDSPFQIDQSSEKTKVYALSDSFKQYQGQKSNSNKRQSSISQKAGQSIMSYKPYTQQDYHQIKQVSSRFGGLGANIGSEDWNKAKNKLDAIQEFSQQVKMQNKHELSQRKRSSPSLQQQQKEKSNREKALEFAKNNIPKPKTKPKTQIDKEKQDSPRSFQISNDLQFLDQQHEAYFDEIEKIKKTLNIKL